MRLTGKTALVTGGSRGIGRAICLELARQGASVAVNYSVQACRAVGAQAFALQADVASSAACQAMLQAVLERFGRLDILVCNAGVARDELMLRLREEDFDTVINTNLKGTFLCMKAACRPMVKQRCGRIVAVSSVVGLRDVYKRQWWGCEATPARPTTPPARRASSAWANRLQRSWPAGTSRSIWWPPA